MEDTVKLTIYVTPELKEQIKEMAKENSIVTSTSNFAVYLITLGIAVHSGEDAFVSRDVIVGPQ